MGGGERICDEMGISMTLSVWALATRSGNRRKTPKKRSRREGGKACFRRANCHQSGGRGGRFFKAGIEDFDSSLERKI